MMFRTKRITTVFYLLAIVVFVSIAQSLIADPVDSTKTEKAKLEKVIVAIRSDATVAMDISLNALSNVIATFNDAEKAITVKLHAGDTSDVKSMVKRLGDVWHSEEDVLLDIAKISSYISMSTSALHNVEIQMSAITANTNNITSNKPYFKKADKASAVARKNVDKASAIAEKLKQQWLVPSQSEALTKE